MAQTPDENGDGTSINRRRLLKAAGAGAVGLTVIPSSASAWAEFYGCSQVCTHSPGTNRRAVVVTDEGNCECRSLTLSNRKDPKSKRMGETIQCYEYDASTEEAVVGLIYCDSSGEVYISNDNNCARNKKDCETSPLPCEPC